MAGRDNCWLYRATANLDAVRAFVAVADAGRFHEAAADLSISRQAVSKRVAALERDLGVRLLAWTAHGSRPTIDGLRSSRTRATSCVPPTGRPPPCGPAAGRCASTCADGASRPQCSCATSTARIPASTSTS